jgi:DNA-binding LytR/AlgR family response regulator
MPETSSLPLRVAIVDDEPLARAVLCEFLAAELNVEVVAQCANGFEAVKAVSELTPDLLLLDVQMPKLDGFEVLDLVGRDVAVVFTTAYDQYALRAFEVHAVDYLLKPVSFERFREAVRLARARLDARAAEVRFAELQQLIASLRESGTPENGATYEREFWVRTRDGIVRIAAENIDAITAEGDYVLLHTGGRSHLLKDTISSLATRLDPAIHLRVHRSTIVNLKQVASLHRRGPKGLSLTLTSGGDYAIGPNYVETVLKLVNARRWR